MAIVNQIRIYSIDNEKDGVNLEIIDLKEKSNFRECSIRGIVSLYITSYGHMLGSQNAMIHHKPFIEETKVAMMNYSLKCSYDEKDVLNGLLEAINYLENNKSIPNNTINVKKLNLLMEAYGEKSEISDFYIPFLESIQYINEKYSIIDRVSSVKILHPDFFDNTLYIYLNPINAIFIKPLILFQVPLLNFILSFKFIFTNKIPVEVLIGFFNLFRINYMPYIKDNMGLGINTFTIFDIFAGKFINKEFDMAFSVLNYPLFSSFFKENNINLNTIEQSLNNPYIQFFNINFKKLFPTDNKDQVRGHEALKVEDEETTVEEEEAPAEETATEDTKEKTTIEKEPNEEETPVEEEEAPAEETATEDTTTNENNEEEEAPVEETVENKSIEEEKKKSPINFKLELNGENENVDDFLYKQYAYNHIRNLLKQNVDTKLTTIMRMIGNQWLFLLSTKTIKKLISNLEKIIKNKGEM